MKYIVLTLDTEDWYHLDYLKDTNYDKSYSMLDGVDTFLDICAQEAVPSTLFILGELSHKLKNKSNYLNKFGHEIATHGWNHKRPMQLSIKEFVDDVKKSISSNEQHFGSKVIGYRAPCFSIDRKRLDVLINKTSLKYDASRIMFKSHPLYGAIDIYGFDTIAPNIYCINDFYEFENNTSNLLGKVLPCSGGGYLRIFPIFIYNKLITQIIQRAQPFFLYMHPYELSSKPCPKLPSSVSALNKFRFQYGRKQTKAKLSKIIKLFKDSGYKFVTFRTLRNIMQGCV